MEPPSTTCGCGTAVQRSPSTLGNVAAVAAAATAAHSRRQRERMREREKRSEASTVLCLYSGSTAGGRKRDMRLVKYGKR
ncbi:hypothetical protein V9T40_010185 [Parthenolecanium corni]|uniref:Uncharacterized protein n=1 Tax=Parthenolecanium corni TaxID=536013 RepID=A0AAN9TC84_9HEMI